MILTLFLFRFCRWCVRDDMSGYSYEFFSILEPIRVGWGGVSTSWICLGFPIFEEVYRCGTCLKKECIITGESKHTIPWIYPIFSEHGLCSEIWDSLETFKEVFELRFSSCHDSLDYSVSENLEYLDMFPVFFASSSVKNHISIHSSEGVKL